MIENIVATILFDDGQKTVERSSSVSRSQLCGSPPMFDKLQLFPFLSPVPLETHQIGGIAGHDHQLNLFKYCAKNNTFIGSRKSTVHSVMYRQDCT